MRSPEYKIWKAIQLDYDKLIAIEEENCGIFALSERTRQICLALLATAKWRTRYFSDSDEVIDGDILDAWTAEAEAELMCEITCCDDILAALAALEVNAANTIYNTTQIWNEANTYIEENTTINENWTYGDEDDEDRDNALCLAIELFIQMFCDACIDIINKGNIETQSKFSLFASIEGAAASITGLLAGFSIFPPALVLAAVALTAMAVITPMIANGFLDSIDAFESATAKKDVRCLIWDYLNGATPTFAQWQDAANGSLSGDSETLRLALAEALDDLELYAQFINLMAPMIGLADSYECDDCGPQGCIVTPDDTGVVPPPTVEFLGGVSWRVTAAQYPENSKWYMQMIIPCGCALQNLTQSVGTYYKTGAIQDCDENVISLPTTAAGIVTVLQAYEYDTIKIQPSSYGGHTAQYVWEFDLVSL